MNNIYSEFLGSCFHLLEVRRPITNTIIVPQGIIHFRVPPKLELDQDTFEISQYPKNNNCSFYYRNVVDDAAFYMKKTLEKLRKTNSFEKYDYIFEFRDEIGNLYRIDRCIGVIPTAYTFGIDYSLDVNVIFDKLETEIFNPAIPISIWKIFNGF